MFFPGLVLEDFLLNRDIAYELERLGYNVIIFKENLDYFRDNMAQFEDFLSKNRPDVIFTYGSYIFDLIKEFGMMKIPLLEIKEIPYISINMDLPFETIKRWITLFRIMKNCKQFTFANKAYLKLANRSGMENVSFLPLSMGYLRQKKIVARPQSNKIFLWQSIIDEDRNFVGYSQEYMSVYERAIKMDNPDFDNVSSYLPEIIRGTLLEIKLLDDIDYYYMQKYRSLLKKRLSQFSWEMQDILLGYPSFKALAEAVQSVPLVLHLPSVFNESGWDSVYWQIWKAGGVSILPKKGIWKDLELAVDIKDRKHFDYVLERLMSDEKARQSYKEEALSIIEKELSWKKYLPDLMKNIESSL